MAVSLIVVTVRRKVDKKAESRSDLHRILWVELFEVEDIATVVADVVVTVVLVVDYTALHQQPLLLLHPFQLSS